MQVKNTMKYHYGLCRMTKIKITLNASETMKKLDFSYTANVNVKWDNQSGRMLGSFLLN